MAITDKNHINSKGDTPPATDNLGDYRMASTQDFIARHGQAPTNDNTVQESKPASAAPEALTQHPLPPLTIVSNQFTNMGNNLENFFTNALSKAKNIEFNREADFNNLYNSDYAQLHFESQNGDLVTQLVNGSIKFPFDVVADEVKSVWDQR
jgi:hypothetical protein